MFWDTAWIGKKHNMAKEEFIFKNLGIRSDYWYLVVSTPTEWATDKIVEFQKEFGYHQCEVMGLNNMVFCFGPLEWPTLSTSDIHGGSLKFNVTQRMACFKKEN
jgi:hypothetical protein